MNKQVQQLDRVVIRFAGDSGDGMQLTGDRFTAETASFGNDLSTLPNFPAEIRAPAGTLPGVSSFQLHFADHDILTPGDAPNVLVAMNPAALKANLADLPRGATIIADTDEFTTRNLTKVGYKVDPLTDHSLQAYHVHGLALTALTVEALKDFGLTRKEAERSKNMFALGLLSWLYGRGSEGTERFLKDKFAAKPTIRDANIAAFRAGWNYGETTEDFTVSYQVKPAPLAPGEYRNITGNLALAYGLIAGAQQARLPLFLGAYPITPASDILHELSRHKGMGVRTFQAEDEIAGVGAALGASFGGALGVTSTSGPGVVLKSETIGLAVSLELPLVIVDVQRAGPATGLPTKTEQSDLLLAMFGRNGECPVAIVAAASPADCFDAAVESIRLATKYRTPTILLSDGYLANGAEPWRIPNVEELPDLYQPFATETNHETESGDRTFWPYKRDPKTLARPWAIPGTPGLEHRIGGIEKSDGHGGISYDPANHDLMVRTRQAKIDGIASDIPRLAVDDPSGAAKVLVLGWGSTYGPIAAACRRVRQAGGQVAAAHLRHLNPFPANTGDVLQSYERVIVPEMNLGQLSLLLRAKYLVDVVGFNKVRGLPFTVGELSDVITDMNEVLAEAERAERAKRRRPWQNPGVRQMPRAEGHSGSPKGAPAGVSPPGLGYPSLTLVPKTDLPQHAKDFKSDQEVRWCPGCGDYAILAAVQGFLPELGLRRENIVFISGIGCSSRFPYYLNTYGMHSIHGRAPAIATGLCATRPDLSVWVVTGDGDALSIGGNHLIHALRRNVNLKILLFNNRIYGLTKGQYSPTSEVGKLTKSSPVGSLDHPFNPVSLALGAEATFVARTIDSDRKHLTGVLRAAAEHSGTALIEIYQNCNIFNDGAFEPLKDAVTADKHLIRLEHGAPIRFGADNERGVVRGPNGTIEVVNVTEEHESEVLIHDSHAEDPGVAFALSRLPDLSLDRTPIGVFRDVSRPTYDAMMTAQLRSGASKAGDLQRMLRGTDTWTIPG